MHDIMEKRMQTTTIYELVYHVYFIPRQDLVVNALVNNKTFEYMISNAMRYWYQLLMILWSGIV